jgi:RNA polymerase sigma-32 factor
MPQTIAKKAAFSQDEGLARYMAEVSRHPILSREDEQRLAYRYVNEGRVEAAHSLVVANLRFVVKLAHEFRAYGLKTLDLIQEGNVGLMVAVKKFDPSRGYRLISYAVWWIRSHMQSYILRSWSLVRVGSSRMQRKLFFRLRQAQRMAEHVAAGRSSKAELTAEVAEQLGVSTEDVTDMHARLAARDFSLDSPLGQTDASPTHVDRLGDDGRDDVHTQMEQAETRDQVQAVVGPIMAELNPKEQHIVAHRLMADEPQSLQEIGTRFCISRERVRQLEVRVKARLKLALAQVAAQQA